MIALPTVLLAFLFGQSRIFLGMARDGLLPTRLAKISTRGVPAVVTVFTAIVVAVLAGRVPLDELASLANAGTLAAFCGGGGLPGGAAAARSEPGADVQGAAVVAGRRDHHRRLRGLLPQPADP